METIRTRIWQEEAEPEMHLQCCPAIVTVTMSMANY
jgi:hypothetical protein